MATTLIIKNKNKIKNRVQSKRSFFCFSCTIRHLFLSINIFLRNNFLDYYTIFRNVLPYSNRIKIPLTLQRTFPFFQTFMTFYKTKGSLFDRFRKFKELLAK